MFDANTANRRERIEFIQFGERSNTIIATVCGLVFAAMCIAGVL